MTQVTLADSRRDWIVPFVLRHAERTGLHAIAAAHALAGFVRYRSFSGFDQRADRANRNTGRLVAVHTHAPHETIVASIDDCKRVC